MFIPLKFCFFIYIIDPDILGAFVGLGRGSKYATTGIHGWASGLGPFNAEASISDATAETIENRKNVNVKWKI